MEITTKSVAETHTQAEEFLKKLTSRKELNTAIVAGLYGDLGSGKTTFVQGLLKTLGVKEYATSPTFVIRKAYSIPKHPHFSELVHIDCYRLESSQELLDLGFDEDVAAAGKLIILEWPERVADILPKYLIPVYFTYIGENERLISYEL